MRRANTSYFGVPLVCALLLSVQAGGQATPVAKRTAASSPRLDHRELPADQQIIQALNRLTFGPRPGDAQNVRAMGLDKWIDMQLHPSRIDDSSLDQFVARYDILKTDQNDLLRQFADYQRERQMVKRDRADSTRDAGDGAVLRQLADGRRQLVAQLQSERVARAVASNRQLEEVMTDFWLNHFNVYLAKGQPEEYYVVEYERDAIRPNALGKFHDILEAVAKSPAMLFYLDNARSMADSTRPRLSAPGRGNGGFNPGAVRRIGGMLARPNRGRAPGGLGGVPRRIGQGVDPAQAGQMQKRLQQLRKGGLNENYGRELLELHTVGVDGGYTQQDVINVARALTGWTIRPPQTGGGFIFRPEMHDAGEKIVLGHKLPAGRGMEDGEDVLNILSHSPATARFIATKLVRRFVADDPPPNLVNDAAATFLRTDGDIREVVRTIITSNEFYSQRAFRSKVKSPFEVVVSAMRTLNAQPDSTPRTAQLIAFLGEPLYGHQAPNGYPETGDAWMNTGAILNRINFGMTVAANRIPGVTLAGLPGIDSLRNAPRPTQVDAVVSLLLSGSASPDTRAVLMKGENPLANSAVGSGADAGGNMADGSAGMVMGGAPMRPNRRGRAQADTLRADQRVGVAADSVRANRRAARQNAVSQDGMVTADRAVGVKKAVGAGGRATPMGRTPVPVPQLTGMAQIVGLALGSPEFQRR